MNGRWLWTGASFALACGSPPAGKPAPAATVRHAVAEEHLATVVLSAEALHRLGIETEVVARGAVGATRTVGGEVMAPPGRAIAVVAPTPGTVLPPEGGGLPGAGASVAKGEPLLRLLALPPDQANVRQSVEVAEARLRQAEAEARRVSELYRDRLVSGREHERAEADLAAARAAASASRAQQAQVERGDLADVAGLAPLRLAAPEAGVVSAVHVAVGQAIAAGMPLLELVSVDRLWVRVPLYAGDARLVLADQVARVRPLGSRPDAAIRAVPVRGPPSADAAAASVDLFYQVAGGGFRPGERVNVELPLAGGRAGTVTVPLSAIVYDAQGGSWVYERLDSLTFARRRVDIARVDADRAILARGPVPGTAVVTAGVAELFGTEFGPGK
jgi:RND family efflux transporter MFP subunit